MRGSKDPGSQGALRASSGRASSVTVVTSPLPADPDTCRSRQSEGIHHKLGALPSDEPVDGPPTPVDVASRARGGMGRRTAWVAG